MSTDVLRYRVGVVVKIEDMIIQSRLWWCGHVILEDEITWLRKKGQPRKSWEECVKKDLEHHGLKKGGCERSKEMGRAN